MRAAKAVMFVLDSTETSFEDVITRDTYHDLY
jgi:hypothetical protein